MEDISPVELADMELGHMIHRILHTVDEQELTLPDIKFTYNAVEPCLSAMQKDAWTIVIDLLEMEAA